MLMAQTAMAEVPSIGYIKTVTGQATVVAAGRAIKAEPGTPVYQDNVLKTGKDGSLGLTLKDNTILSMGPDTEMVVDEYLYAPAQDQLKLGGRLAKGSLNYVSGVIAKLKPENVVMRTPSGNIGVRGTHFAVSVVED